MKTIQSSDKNQYHSPETGIILTCPEQNFCKSGNASVEDMEEKEYPWGL